MRKLIILCFAILLSVGIFAYASPASFTVEPGLSITALYNKEPVKSKISIVEITKTGDPIDSTEIVKTTNNNGQTYFLAQLGKNYSHGKK